MSCVPWPGSSCPEEKKDMPSPTSFRNEADHRIAATFLIPPSYRENTEGRGRKISVFPAQHQSPDVFPKVWTNPGNFHLGLPKAATRMYLIITCYLSGTDIWFQSFVDPSMAGTLQTQDEIFRAPSKLHYVRLKSHLLLQHHLEKTGASW